MDGLDSTTVEAVMHRAIELAAREFPHPNPRVGAIVLDRAGEPVGDGAHVRPGEAHAEQLALAAAGTRARGGTMVVTLEPCAHHGRTPPCADALVEAGITKVVAAVEDPDQRVAGRGFELLRAAGISVEIGVGSQAATEMDAGYFRHRRSGRPRVTAVATLTLDGQAGASDEGLASELLSDKARDDIRRLRGRVDGVMVGSGFLDAFDPRLDAPGDRQPRPIIVVGNRSPIGAAQAFNSNPIVITPAAAIGSFEGIVAPDENGDQADLAEALRRVAELGILDVQVEGGRSLVSSLERAGLIDSYRIYVVPRIGGGVGRSLFDGVLTRMAGARSVEITDIHTLGPDVRIDARVQE